MAEASTADFSEVINALGPDELQHLFHNLGISQQDIEHAERSADTADTRLKAWAVLNWWKQTKGKDATCEALFEAKRDIHSVTGIIERNKCQTKHGKLDTTNCVPTTWHKTKKYARSIQSRISLASKLSMQGKHVTLAWIAGAVLNYKRLCFVLSEIYIVLS